MKYRVLVGCNYSGKRAEPGDIVEDIPARSVAWLKRGGVIETVEEEPSPEPKPKPKRSRKGAGE